VALLLEIAKQHPKSLDRKSSIIPCQDGRMHGAEEVFYPDVELFGNPHGLIGKFATHNSISRGLSNLLSIPPLSSLRLDLGVDAFDNDEQMGEDLLDRIKLFLREYSVEFALNEFLANADDAQAQEVCITLDDQRHSSPSGDFIHPAFQVIQNLPSVILSNDAILSDNDLKGLRRV